LNFFPSFKLIREKIKQIKHIEIFLAIIILAVIASIFCSTLTPKEKIDTMLDTPQDNGEESIDESTELSLQKDIEAQLTDILSSIQGAGRISVMVTLETGIEIITASDINKSNTITEEEDGQGGKRRITEDNVSETTVTITENGDTKPVILKKSYPSIKGVIVVSEGARVPEVKRDLSEAVQTVLGISANRVKVFVMED
jgi:stage III sporulation protein AG